MRYKMTYVFLMLLLFFSIPYLVTVFIGDPGKEQEIEFDTYDRRERKSHQSLSLNSQSCKYMLLILERKMIGVWLRK